MNRLKDIPVTVEGTPPDMARSHGNTLPLLYEIAVLLDDLVATGKSASIDLRSLPMLPEDYETLHAALGEGEVSAAVNALGPTQVRETAVHGVWWITHRNAAGDVIAEFIEVTYSPGILTTHPADASAAAAMLHSRLARPAPTMQGDDHAG